MSGEHQSALQKLCRVCGKNVYKGKTARQYKCFDHQADLRETFGLDIALDSCDKHPPFFCQTCKNVIYCQKRAVTNNRDYTNRVTVKEWEYHIEQICEICHSPAVSALGGRPKKLKKEGRPQIQSIPSLLKHIRDIAPRDIPTGRLKIIQIPSEYLCPLCNELLKRPIELGCGKYVCAMCYCNEIKKYDLLTCPFCHENHLCDYVTKVKAAPEIVLAAIDNLTVTCIECEKSGKLKDYPQHLQSSCQLQTNFTLSSDIATMLEKPSDIPLTSVEEKVQSALVNRSMSTSSSGTLKVQTGGQVSKRVMSCNNC